MLEQTGSRRGRFDQCTAGRQVAAQHRDARVLADRILSAVNHLRVPARRTLGVLAHGLAIHSQSVFVDQVSECAHHGRNSACVVEIFHQKLARWHEVHQQWQLVAQPVEIVQF